MGATSGMALNFSDLKAKRCVMDDFGETKQSKRSEGA